MVARQTKVRGSLPTNGRLQIPCSPFLVRRQTSVARFMQNSSQKRRPKALRASVTTCPNLRAFLYMAIDERAPDPVRRGVGLRASYLSNSDSRDLGLVRGSERAPPLGGSRVAACSRLLSERSLSRERWSPSPAAGLRISRHHSCRGWRGLT